MEIAHFSVFQGQKHDFLESHPIVLTFKSSTFKASFLKSTECGTSIFKSM